MTKTSLLFAAILATAAVAAQADELYTPQQYQDPANSGLTRAQVKQSVLAARRTGGLDHNDVDQPAPVAQSFGKTRAQVKQEVLAARADGDLVHNDVDQPQIASGSVRTRAEVRAEALASRKDSTNAPGRNTIAY
jgi:hypothetical protein